MFCALCGQHARHPKSPEMDLRRKECPRFSTPGAPAVVHRGCCAREACSEMDGRGHVRCAWQHGGRERVAQLKLRARDGFDVSEAVPAQGQPSGSMGGI